MKKIFILVCLFFPATLWAYGAFHPCPDGTGGTPCKWNTNRIIWKYDPGQLSSRVPATMPSSNRDFCSQPFHADNPCAYMDRCGAVACIDWLFRRWTSASMLMADGRTSVPATNLTVVNGGAMELTDGDTEINISNYQKYINLAIESGIVVVIFDNDGAIIDRETEAAAGTHSNILGISQPYIGTGSNFYTGGAAMFNGLFLDGDPSNGEKGVEAFAASMFHELGHVIGLDHSQPLRDAIGSTIDAAADVRGITTMYPRLIDESQLILHEDDVVGIGYLYPSSDFNSRMCTITGSLQDSNNSPFQGVNVIAHVDVEAEKLIDSRSNVSGSLYPAAASNSHVGDYILQGIIPCKPYKVEYEPIYHEFQNYGGGLNPYGPIPGTETLFRGPTDADLTSAVITVSNGAAGVVMCDPDNTCGSDTAISTTYTAQREGANAFNVVNAKDIRMDTASLGSESGQGEGGGSTTTETGRRGWCMSVAGPVNPLWTLLLPLLVGGLYFSRNYFKK